MNRRQLAFIVLVNAVVSLAIALLVAWVVDMRRPDPEELAALVTPAPPANMAITAAVSGANSSSTTPVVATPAAVATAIPTTASVAPIGSNGTDERSVYVVQSGDTLLTIAAQFGVSMDAIMEANGLDDPDFVFVGQRLALPGDATGTSGGDTANATQRENSPAATTSTDGPGVQIAAISGAGDLSNEELLVVNESNTPYNLQGWQVEREDGPVYVFGNLPLFPGANITLHSGAGADSSVDLYWGQSQAVWESDTTARLRNANGDVVDSFVAP